MLSHLAFVCAKEGRPCPLYAVGCNEVHSLADADSSSHLKLLLEARVSGACGVSLCSSDLISKFSSRNILVNKYLIIHIFMLTYYIQSISKWLLLGKWQVGV